MRHPAASPGGEPPQLHGVRAGVERRAVGRRIGRAGRPRMAPSSAWQPRACGNLAETPPASAMPHSRSGRDWQAGATRFPQRRRLRQHMVAPLPREALRRFEGRPRTASTGTWCCKHGGLRPETIARLEELGEQIDGPDITLRRLRHERRPIARPRRLAPEEVVETWRPRMWRKSAGVGVPDRAQVTQSRASVAVTPPSLLTRERAVPIP